MAEAEATQLKEEGNQHFQRQDYKAATKSYSQALKLTKDKALLATLYRNRAACGLKMVWGQDSVGGLRAVKAGVEVVMACGSEPPSSPPCLLDPLNWQVSLVTRATAVEKQESTSQSWPTQVLFMPWVIPLKSSLVSAIVFIPAAQSRNPRFPSGTGELAFKPGLA